MASSHVNRENGPNTWPLRPKPQSEDLLPTRNRPHIALRDMCAGTRIWSLTERSGHRMLGTTGLLGRE